MQFVVQSGAEPGKTYDLALNKKYSIGRQSANEIVVSDEQVSRRHAEVQAIPNGILVTDLGSSNGTFINGTRVSSPQTIGPGDTLQVGTTVLRLVDSQNADSTLPAGYDQPAPLSSNSYGTVNLGTNAAPANPATINLSTYAQQNPVNPAYGQAGAPSQTYGQAGAANPSYGQPNAGGPSSTFAQPNAGGSSSGFGQPSSANPVQPYNQAQPPNSSASYSPAPAGSNSYNNNAYPNNAYLNNANPANAVAKKGLPQPLIIGIIVAVVVVILLVIFLVVILGGHSSSTTSLVLPNSLMLSLYNLALLL